MATDQINVTFECKSCGGDKISLPDDPRDDSMATCSSCGVELGRWGDIRKASLKAVKNHIDKEIKGSLRKFPKGG